MRRLNLTAIKLKQTIQPGCIYVDDVIVPIVPFISFPQFVYAPISCFQ